MARAVRTPSTGVIEAAAITAGPSLCALLLGLAVAPGPLAVGVMVGAAAGVPGFVALVLLARRPRSVSAADRVTLTRAALAGVLAALAVLVLAGEFPARSWPVLLVAVIALASDAIDGRVARARRTAGRAGARLDVEADTALLLVLVVLAAPTVGWWVVVIGALRLVFVAASALRPALRAQLPYSGVRRVIAAVQGVALLIALIPVVPVGLGQFVLGVALALLILSFCRDVVALERAYPRRTSTER